jgi:hypothetical protein
MTEGGARILEDVTEGLSWGDLARDSASANDNGGVGTAANDVEAAAEED